ncbi:hypothetical protein JCM3774_005021 [Rhodotorula dairenensis]
MELVISDSEPEASPATQIFRRQSSPPAAAPPPLRRPRRLLGPKLTAEQQDHVVVLSSSGSEGEGDVGTTSRFFTHSKRKRAASPPPIEWASIGLKGISPLAGQQQRSESATSAAAAAVVREGTEPSAKEAVPASTFVSALELLRQSGSPPGSDSSDLEPLQPLESTGRTPLPSSPSQSTRPPPHRAAKVPTVNKITARSLTADPPKGSKPVTASRGRSADSEVGSSLHRPAKRRSVSPVTSSGGEDKVFPAPQLWADRYTRGTSTAASLTRSESSGAAPSSSRAKPWEALEAKVAKCKKPSRKEGGRIRPLRQASLGLRASDSTTKDEGGSDSDVIVTSKAPARSSSSVSRRRMSIEMRPAPPIDLPPEDCIRVLARCALCSVPWPSSKTLATKRSHLRSCAAKLDYTTETVRYLVEKHVLELADAAEADRRAADDGKTLFDRAVGKGEGAHAMRDVTVVGVEGLESGSGVEWYKATSEVQAELDLARKKAHVAKVIKVAKQIRHERAALESRRDAELSFAVPASTGRLQPAAATLVAERVDAVLGVARGGVILADDSDGDSCADESAALPSTQEFQESRFAKSYDPQIGEGFGRSDPPAVGLSSRPLPRCETAAAAAAKEEQQSRSPFRQLSLPDPRSGSISRQGHPPFERELGLGRRRYSLWQLAAGRDDAKLDTVVLQKPAHLALAASVADSSTRRHSAFAADHGRDENACGDVVLVGGANDSSEEEALAQVVRKSRTRRSRSDNEDQSASAPDPIPAPAPTPPASSARTDPPGMPDYGSLAVATLQRKVRQYGFRASKEKDVLVAQLRQVWIAMHPDAGDDGVSAVGESVGDGGGGGDKRKKSRKKRTSLADESSDETAANQMKPTGRTRTKKQAAKRPVEVGGEEDDAPADEGVTVPGNTVGEKLRHLIVNHKTLYLRILRYEPIHIDEFAALATEHGVKVARPLLMRFLDEQSITHYSQDPTGGTRRRYR